MNKKEANSMRWSQYDIELPPLDPNLMEECVEIIDNLNSRKADKVNWEERKAMDEVTKRSGHYINSGEDEEIETAQQIDETAGATNEKEKDLMSGMSDILKELEQLDG